MADALNLPSDCCNPVCSEQVTLAVPGPAGADGAAGAAGTNGTNAFTTLTANFTMPAELATAVADVGTSAWATIGQVLYLQGAGWLRVTAKPSATQVTLRNLEDTANGLYTENVAPATVIASGSSLSPGGLQGPTGLTGVSTLNAISPTTTKGDLIVDNGGSSPAASVVRYGVGTDGQIDTAQSSTATGHQYKTLLPLGTATPSDTDNRIPRFDAAAGNEEPAPLQTSGMVISDTGAIQSTGTGGNARGTSATDLQVVRTVATQVASGTRAVIVGGINNTASALDSAVVGGDSNTASVGLSFIGGGDANTVSGVSAGIVAGGSNIASANRAFIGAGQSNTASGDRSVVSGGLSNTASADRAVVAGGQANTCSGQFSVCSGGNSAVADKYGQSVNASGNFTTVGDAQRSNFVARTSTTDATPATMFLDGTGGSQRLTIGASTSWTFRGLVVGRRDNGDTASWSFQGGIHNNGGTTALIAAVTATLIATDAGASATWGVAASISVTADNTNDALSISVTGSGGNNIRWVCHIDTVETTF